MQKFVKKKIHKKWVGREANPLLKMESNNSDEEFGQNNCFYMASFLPVLGYIVKLGQFN